MVPVPFYKVISTFDNLDLSELISSLRFEDCINEDNQLILTIGKASLELVSQIGALKGTELTFQY